MKKIKQIRIKFGITQNELCGELGITQSYLSNIENGKVRNKELEVKIRVVLERMKSDIEQTEKELLEIKNEARKKARILAEKKHFLCQNCGELVENGNGMCNTCGAYYCRECNEPISFNEDCLCEKHQNN